MSQKQSLGSTLKQKQYKSARQIQDLCASQDLSLDLMIREALLLNPSIQVDEGPDFDEDACQEIPDGWNPDFVMPEDEWETGDSPSSDSDGDIVDLATGLEKSAEDYCGDDIECLNRALNAIDIFRMTGKLPERVEQWLADSLLSIQESIIATSDETYSITPAFDVRVTGGSVTAIVAASIAEFTSVKKISGFADLSRKFLEQKRNRLIFLNSLAKSLLENLQSDFFWQKDIKSAILALVPVPVDYFSKLEIQSPIKVDKAYLSRLGSLLVSCPLGVFPVSLFWPEKAAIIRAWVRTAQVKGIDKVPDMRNWIINEIGKRKNKWSHDDKRQELISPLLELNDNDISNAKKKICR